MPRIRRPKKAKTKSARRPAEARAAYVVSGPARPPTVKERAKQVAFHLLDVAEKDPEKFLTGIERAARGVEALYTVFQTNPGEAKRTLRNAAIAAAAKVAKQKL